LHPIHVPFELKILKKYQSNTYICAMSLGSLKGYWALFYTHHWTIPYCVFKTFGFKIIGAGSLDLRSKYFSIQAGLYGPIKDLYEKLLHINKTAIDPLIFRGIINGYLFAEGPLDNFNAIRGGIRLLGSPLSVDKIQFTELDLRCFLNRSMLIIPLSRVGIGKGHGELFSWFDCKDPFHYGLNLSFEKIQFGHLLSVVLGKPQDIDGIAYGKMTAFGQGKDIRDIKGFANIHIDDISNWNIKLTSRYLSMINYFLPGLSEAVFNRATVSLALYKGWCWIREMKILSPAISMETAGKIGLLQGDLDMLLRIKPSKMSTNPKYFFSKALLLSLKALGGDLVDFSIQGTLSDPSFSRVHLPEDASLTSLFFAPVRMLTPAKKDKN
ncbi:MAG: hypothetical protein Q8Q33_10900, partial [Chlamydiota bacterium]|nr:hypothetical protein [Chlamydiota bacterium]